MRSDIASPKRPDHVPRDGTGVAAFGGAGPAEGCGLSDAGMIENCGAACLHGKRLSTIGFPRFKRGAGVGPRRPLKHPSGHVRFQASGMMLAYRIRYVSDYKTTL
jgi:hypothetical protein